MHFVAAALPVGRLLHRFSSCNGAVRCACCAFPSGARLPALTVAAARPRLSLLLSGGPNFAAPQHLCRCHGVVRLPQQRAELPCGMLVFYSSKHQVANTTRSRSIARAHIVMWTTSECGGVLVRCVIKPSCTLESLTLHHCASPPTRPIVLLRVRVLMIKATEFIYSCDDTTAAADMRSAACCCYRCVASAATRSGARCRCHSAALSHSAALFLLTHLLPRALRGLCCICCPTFSYLTAPPVILRRHHAGPSATLTRPASYRSSRREGSAALSKFDLLVVFLHLHWCSYDACQIVNLAQRVPVRQMSRQVPFSGNPLYKYSS